MIGLMAFLGNPGKEYAKTRHNAGFMLCDYLYPGMTYQMKYHSQFAKAGSIMILRPMTFMNLSGTAVSEAASFLKLKSDEILTAELVYAGQEIAVTSTSVSLYNERQKVEVKLYKDLEKDELFQIGIRLPMELPAFRPTVH